MLFRKRKHIRLYISKLPNELKRYGLKPYTEQQIDEAIKALGLSERYTHYAYYLYANKQQFIDNHSLIDRDVYQLNKDIEFAIAPNVIIGYFLTSFSSHNDSSDSSGIDSSFDGGSGE